VLAAEKKRTPAGEFKKMTQASGICLAWSDFYIVRKRTKIQQKSCGTVKNTAAAGRFSSGEAIAAAAFAACQ
jgi:hypothetical protein